MRPVEFTDTEIIEAGKSIRAAGRNVTGFGIRQRIGGGKPERLRQVWDEYVTGQAASTGEAGGNLPAEVAEAEADVVRRLADQLHLFAVEVNTAAVRAASDQIDEANRRAAEQQSAAVQEMADAAQTIDEQAARLDEMTAASETLRGELSALQTSHEAQGAELATLRERLRLIEAECTRQEQTIETLRRERDAARDEAANLRGQVAALQAIRETTAQPRASARQPKK